MDNSVIQELLRIDAEAQKAIGLSVSEKEQALSESKHRLEELSAEYSLRVQRDIASIANDKKAWTDSEFKRLDSEFNDKKIRLLNLFSQNKAAWEKSIVDSCLGR